MRKKGLPAMRKKEPPAMRKKESSHLLRPAAPRICSAKPRVGRRLRLPLRPAMREPPPSAE
jgi:hypothetical protein